MSGAGSARRQDAFGAHGLEPDREFGKQAVVEFLVVDLGKIRNREEACIVDDATGQGIEVAQHAKVVVADAHELPENWAMGSVRDDPRDVLARCKAAVGEEDDQKWRGALGGFIVEQPAENDDLVVDAADGDLALAVD